MASKLQEYHKGPKNNTTPKPRIFIGYTCGPVYGSGCHYIQHLVETLITDVTLADEYANSVQTDGVDMATLGKMEMQLVPFGGQVCN